MDSFWSILIVVAIIIISDQVGGQKKKVPKRPLPRPEGGSLPKMPDIRPPETSQQREEPEIYVEPVLKAPVPRQAETAVREPEHRREPAVTSVRPGPTGLTLTPEQAISALAWSEILGQPKAYRGGRFRK